MAEHTPGTWRVNLSPQDADGIWTLEVVADGPGWPPAAVIHELHKPGDEPWEANARLIAAAPDLLAACEEIIEKLRDLTSVDRPDNEPLFSTRRIMERAEAAIAKARGTEVEEKS